MDVDTVKLPGQHSMEKEVPSAHLGFDFLTTSGLQTAQSALIKIAYSNRSFRALLVVVLIGRPLIDIVKSFISRAVATYWLSWLHRRISLKGHVHSDCTAECLHDMLQRPHISPLFRILVQYTALNSYLIIGSVWS